MGVTVCYQRWNATNNDQMASPSSLTCFRDLQCVEYPLTKQREPGSAESHALEKLQFVHTSLDYSITMRQGQASKHRRFISLDAAGHFLKFTNLALPHILQPGVQPLAFATTKHAHEVLFVGILLLGWLILGGPLACVISGIQGIVTMSAISGTQGIVTRKNWSRVTWLNIMCTILGLAFLLIGLYGLITG